MEERGGIGLVAARPEHHRALTANERRMKGPVMPKYVVPSGGRKMFSGLDGGVECRRVGQVTYQSVVSTIEMGCDNQLGGQYLW